MERSLITGELDPFDFFLATELKTTVSDVRGLPNPEYVAWRGYYNWKHALEEREHNKGSGGVVG